MATKRSRAALGSSLQSAVDAVGRPLSEEPRRGMLIGGIAVIARGVARTTRNVDATIDGTGLDLRSFVTELSAHSIVPRIDDILGFAEENRCHQAPPWYFSASLSFDYA